MTAQAALLCTDSLEVPYSDNVDAAAAHWRDLPRVSRITPLCLAGIPGLCPSPLSSSVTRLLVGVHSEAVSDIHLVASHRNPGHSLDRVLSGVVLGKERKVKTGLASPHARLGQARAAEPGSVLIFGDK